MNRNKVLLLAVVGFFSLNTIAKKVEKNGDLILIKDKNNVYCQNSFFRIPLDSRKKHLFRFVDKQKKAPLVLSTWIWYHGRSVEKGVFYQAHNETAWPLKSIDHEWSKDKKTLTVYLKSSNNDWLVTREVKLYSNKPYVKLRYKLEAKEYFPRDKYVAPLVELLRDFTEVSYETTGKYSPVQEIKKISGKTLTGPATIVQFFAPKYKRTLTIINNANLAVKNGFDEPASFICRDLKKLKRLHLSNSSLQPNFYLKKGQTMDTELLFLLQEGAKPNVANQEKAGELAEKFKFLPDAETTKFARSKAYRTKASELARTLKSDSNCDLWYESSLKKVFPAFSKPEAKTETVRVFSAKNEKESFQLVVKPKKELVLEKVSVSGFLKDGKVFDNIKTWKYLLEYQKKDTIPGVYGMEDLFADKLLELQKVLPCKFTANKAQPLWFTVGVPEGMAAGAYKAQITLKFSDKSEIKVPVSLRVWNFALPQKYPYRAVGTVGWSSPKSKRMDYIKKMSEYHISGNLLPGDGKSKLKLFDGKRIHMDEFVKRAKIASEQYHNNTLLLPNTFLGNCSWRPGKRVAFRNMDPRTKEFDAAYRSYLQQCSELLKKNGLAEGIVVKVWDEIPTPGYPIFEKATKIIRSVNPDFKIQYVGAPDEKLVKLADIICPGAFSSWWGEKAEKIINKYRAEGKEFWVYLNHLTFSVDQEAAVTRLVPWMCWTRGISGYYQWGVDAGWKRGDFNTHGNVWLFYPSSEEPVPSVRLEYFRDGIEDYVYFRLLEAKSKNNKALEKVLEISPKFAPVKIDVKQMHDLRMSIGELLDKSAR